MHCVIPTGSVVEVFVDTNDVLNGIYYQDEHMQDVYSKYPEILFIDATHKLNDLRMPLYVLLVEDGNGESVIVAVSLVLHEDAAKLQIYSRNTMLIRLRPQQLCVTRILLKGVF